jgi:hypothetical protein
VWDGRVWTGALARPMRGLAVAFTFVPLRAFCSCVEIKLCNFAPL